MPASWELCAIEQFQLNFWPTEPKMAAILNFPQNLQNTKMLISRKPWEIDRFRWIFWPTGYLYGVAIPIFKKIFKKNGSYFEFSNFSQKLKTQKCKYLESVLDRAISMKFFIRGVSLQSSHPDFPKIFVSQYMPFLWLLNT